MRARGDALHDAEAFAHKALEAGAPEDLVGELLVGEHGERGLLRESAIICEASSMVREESWAMHCMTMFIMVWRRRRSLASSSDSCVAWVSSGWVGLDSCTGTSGVFMTIR